MPPAAANMKFHWGLKWATFASILTISLAIPASLVDEIKANEMRENKVKRAHPDLNNNPEEQARNIPYYNKPTAAKRGANLKNPTIDQQTLNEWEQEQNLYQNPDNLANIQSTLYNNDNLFDDKTVAEYEKGFQYGTNKEKLDEALENAVLKSELYGEPSSINQYRYYGDEQRRRKKRSSLRRIRMNDNRIKREVDLTPEEFLAILTLYENDRQQNNRPWQRFDNSDDEYDPQDVVDDEQWLETPVYPHSINDIGPNYQVFNEEKRPIAGRWGGGGTAAAAADNRNKRFMVAKKRNDPTREIRYLNGPSKNNFYTLSQLLNNNQRDPNVPVYHRVVL